MLEVNRRFLVNKEGELSIFLFFESCTPNNFLTFQKVVFSNMRIHISLKKLAQGLSQTFVRRKRKQRAVTNITHSVIDEAKWEGVEAFFLSIYHKVILQEVSSS